MAIKSNLFLICCAGALAAVSGWKVGDELFLRSAEAAFAKSRYISSDTLQMSNRDAKRDREFVVTPRAETPPADSNAPILALARIEPDPQPAAQPVLQKPDLQEARAELTPAPQPAPKPKAMAKIEKIGRALLSDYQISGIKQRLALTSAQERYWPAVEKALRGLSERVVEYRKLAKRTRDEKYVAEAAQVEDLKSAAVPLLAQLRDDQKSTVIVMANMAGLGSVVNELFSGAEVANAN
ncbi:MAG: hypothetical protein HY242_04025 [Afipia sp.]|nr:hypothetical protein [Afipia sp.]